MESASPESPDVDLPEICLNRCFSKASEQLERSSLTNTSLSVYIDFATISSNFFVSALNSRLSVSLRMGSSGSMMISYSVLVFACSPFEKVLKPKRNI